MTTSFTDNIIDAGGRVMAAGPPADAVAKWKHDPDPGEKSGKFHALT